MRLACKGCGCGLPYGGKGRRAVMCAACRKAAEDDYHRNYARQWQRDKANGPKVCKVCEVERRLRDFRRVGNRRQDVCRECSQAAEPLGKLCPVCAGLAHRVRGQQCRRCGLPYAVEVVEVMLVSPPGNLARASESRHG